MNVPAFTLVSRLIDVGLYPFLFLLWLFILFYKDKRLEKLKSRIWVLLLAAILVAASVQITKTIVNSPRPCTDSSIVPISKIQCPSDGSFPSGHAAAAALLIPFFLGTAIFDWYILFYLVVSTSRIYLGVHTLLDVLAGTLFGLISYFIADLLIMGRRSFVGSVFSIKSSGEKKRLSDKSELKRKAIHVLIGLSALILFIIFYSLHLFAFYQLLLLVALIIGLLALNHKLQGKKLPIIDFFLIEFERPNTIPGYGSLWLVIGLLITAVFLSNASQIIATIFILTFSDAIATIVGRKGKIVLPYNKNKTLEGTITFFVISLLSWFFIGPIAIALSLFLTLIESLPLYFDDNILIPLASVVFFSLL